MAQKKKDEASPDFEASLRRLEGIVEKLEKGEIPLDQALNLYEEGIGLARVCATLLTNAEVRLKRLGRDLEGNLKLFEQEEDNKE
jgi:exodeoxyribonuclease VII small subunit